MILVGITSLWLTKPELRAANGFDWEPIKEVAKTLAAISLGVVFMGVNTYIGNAREPYGLCDSAAHRGKHARFFPIWSGLLRYLCGSYLAVLSLDGMGQLLAQGWRTRRVDATIAPRERILYEEF